MPPARSPGHSRKELLEAVAGIRDRLVLLEEALADPGGIAEGEVPIRVTTRCRGDSTPAPTGPQATLSPSRAKAASGRKGGHRADGDVRPLGAKCGTRRRKK